MMSLLGVVALMIMVLVLVMVMVIVLIFMMIWFIELACFLGCENDFLSGFALRM